MNLYFDNAATTFPKAPMISDAMRQFIEYVGGNINRGNYKSAMSAGQVVYETRELLCNLFNFNEPLNVVFTKNITESLNILIKGFLKPNDHVIVSSMEHNAVMRPLNSLLETGVSYDRVDCDMFGRMNPKDLEDKIKENTRLVIVTHASNVCGTMLPVEEIGKICKRHNIHFIMDSAQTAGVYDIDFKKLNLSALPFTGHKGLLGPQGTGGFLIDPKFAQCVSPFIMGGTGSLSESEEQPQYLPDKYESGTINIPGIYGLNASLKYIVTRGMDEIREIEEDLLNHFTEQLLNIKGVKLTGFDSTRDRTCVVSLDFPNFDNAEVAYNLDKEFGIMTRVGLHCAPSAHKTIKTFPKGTVRFSPGHFMDHKDIDNCVAAIKKTIDMLK